MVPMKSIGNIVLGRKWESLHEQLLFLQESGAMFGIQPTLTNIYKMI